MRNKKIRDSVGQISEAEEKYDNALFNKLGEETRRDYIYQMLSLIRSVKAPQ